MLKYNGHENKDYNQTCTVCGYVAGDDVQTCPRCMRREMMIAAGHYGSTDVWGNWECYSGCPACAEEDEPCPNCSSLDVDRCHHNPSAADPECDYWECMECGEQWGHE